MSLFPWNAHLSEGLGRDDAARPLARTDSPHREIWIGVAAIAVFIGLITIWSLAARLDEGVTAPGQVVVSGNRQAVQTKDGGVVGKLLVREGDHVVSGQTLLEIDVAELKASAQALSNAIIEQEALEARLNTEMAGPGEIGGARLASNSPEDRAAAAAAARLQALELNRRQAALKSNEAVLNEEIRQIQEQIGGYDRQLDANKREQVLIEQELTSLKDLAEKGFVPMSRIRQLQRSEVELEGSASQLQSQRASAMQEIGEHRIKIQGLLTDRDADDSHTYRESELSLAELRPKLAAAEAQIDRAIIRSPATGRVVGLSVFTVGGVVAPGQKLMDVVPENRPMVINARVKPSDAEALRINQKAEVRISAFHGARAPTITGKVTRISADALSDEKNGTSYFTIEVEVPSSEVEKLGEPGGENAVLKPGFPAEVILPLRARSAISYLLEPLGRSLWTSFRQH